MNIVKRSPGIMLLEQYGNKYIRYDAGQISDVLLQVRITEEEFDRVQKDEITMKSVVNYYDNRGLCSADELRNSLVKDYLRATSDYSEKRLTSIITKLIAHKDVYFEFYDYVLYEQFPEDAIVVEGLSAQQLATSYPLSPLGAYNYLIYLREMPEKALADLKAGLPTKDSSKIETITNQEEVQKTMDIDDYVAGTAYIFLNKSDFKNPCDFEKILAFLKLPLDTRRIEIGVEKGSYR